MKIQFFFLLVATMLSINGFSQKDSAVTFLYFNDAHEISPVIDEEGNRGGVARLKTVIDQAKVIDKNPVVLFGGDLGGGTLFGGVFKGFPMVEAFNLLPVDYANFGQHDFDFGTVNTRELVKQSNFTWITANLTDENGNTFAGLPNYVIRTVNGIRIGLLGLTDAMNTTTPDNKVRQTDLLEAAGLAVGKLKQNDVDIIISITQTDVEINKKLLEIYPEIDAIFTEEISESYSQTLFSGSRPIISTCGNMGSLAKLVISFKQGGKYMQVEISGIDNLVREDPEMLVLQSFYQAKLDSTLDVFIADLETGLEAGVNSDFKCRWGETNIGNLITDAFRDYYTADAAVINGGGIRANIPKGKLTLRGAWSVLPFQNEIVKVKISGEDILNMLEHGVGNTQERGGEFLQISGANYVYAPGSQKGQKIVSVKIAGQPLIPGNYYTLALPLYILKGGNNFKFNDTVRIIEQEKMKKDVDILVEYCRKMKIINLKPEDRITIQIKTE